jgi:hypothetical protein
MPGHEGRKRVRVSVDVRAQQGRIVKRRIVKGCMVKAPIIVPISAIVVRLALDQASTSTS